MNSKSYSRWDWFSAMLLIFIVFSVSVRLNTTHWTADLGYVESMAVLGTILGLAVGVSHFKKSTQGWLVFFYTIAIVPANLSRIISGENTQLGQMTSLLGRLYVSFSLLFTGKPVPDSIFFVSQMAVIFWLVGLVSGINLMRTRSILQILLPSLLPLLLIQYYDGYQPERIWSVALYFFLGLMLAGRINLLNSRTRWAEGHVIVGSDPEFDLNRNIFTTAAILILLAWLLPAPSAVIPAAAKAWQGISAPLQNLNHRWNDIFAALQSGRPIPSGEFYGAAMGLGRTAGKGESTLFSVHAPTPNLPRQYWRMRVYDTYQKGVWQNNQVETEPFDPANDILTPAGFLPDPPMLFTFSWASNPSGVLITPLVPVWASRKGSIQVSSTAVGAADPLSWYVSRQIQPGDSYSVRAYVLNPTQKQLRETGEIPDWIRNRYLQVPQEIAESYRQLANQITSLAPTNFDKAEAVTSYLRNTIQYSETIPAPPLDVDPMEWFLFEHKAGFCNYFASADVLLLRSVGIPARLAVGFAEGDPRPNNMFLVRGQDIHAWPEVYFPNSGWVQFEPTTSQNVILRPSGETGNSAANPNFSSRREKDSENNPAANPGKDNSGVENAWNVQLLRWGWWLAGLLGLTLLGYWIWKMQSRESFSQRVPNGLKTMFALLSLKNPTWLEDWLRWNEVSEVERDFHAVNQSLRWLNKKQPGDATPAERVRLLKTLLPAASQEIDTLSQALEMNLFSNHPVPLTHVVWAGWKLRFLTVQAILRAWFEEHF